MGQGAEAKEILKGREDPSWWVRTILGSNLWTKQVEVLDGLQRSKYISVASCHAAGKSFVTARAVLWYLYNHCPSIVITTAPTNRQVRGILWKEIKLAHMRANMPLGGEILSQEIRIEPDWFAFGFTAPERESDKFQGFHAEHVLVAVDEASGVSEEIFEAIDGILTGVECRMLMISNPLLSAGRFFDSFKDPEVLKITISAFDTPNFTKFGITLEDIREGTWRAKWNPQEAVSGLVTPEWVARQLRKHGEDSPFFITRVLGHFPIGTSDTLIPLEDVLRAQKLYQESALEAKPDYDSIVELVVDVARFGSDETVIGLRRGRRLSILWAGNKRDTMYVAGRVKNFYHQLREEPSAIKVDVIGVGAGVVDRLQEQGLPVISMDASAAPLDEDGQYLNRRAEWWDNLRQLFREGEIELQPDELMASQLASLKYDYNSKGLLVIESKKEYKKRMKQSPDRGDIVAMAFAETEPQDIPLLIGRA